eukprot:s76_g42.t1
MECKALSKLHLHQGRKQPGSSRVPHVPGLPWGNSELRTRTIPCRWSEGKSWIATTTQWHLWRKISTEMKMCIFKCCGCPSTSFVMHVGLTLISNDQGDGFV